MKKCKILLPLTAACLLFLSGAQAQVKKVRDWETAATTANSSGKHILIILTGKEWCAPCVELQKNVVETPQFGNWANREVVVFEIDIPKSHLGKRNSKIVAAYDELSEKYGTKALPSLILVDSKGQQLAKLTEGPWSLDRVMPLLESTTK